MIVIQSTPRNSNLQVEVLQTLQFSKRTTLGYCYRVVHFFFSRNSQLQYTVCFYLLHIEGENNFTENDPKLTGGSSY